jgi:chromosome segregation ATPase
MSWLVNPVNLPNNMKLYAAPPADGVDVTVSETPRTGVLVPEGELAALRAEIEELKGQVNNRDNALETRAITLREVQSALMRETTAREEAERKLAELMKEGG